MKNDLISVIVPVYKVEEYLPKCIESILNQTYKNIELILVDDGSPDNSPKICDEYASKDKRVKVIHKKNAGVSAARNDGINAASGKFITFVDSDDWIESEMYEKLYEKQQEKDYDVVMCGFKLVMPDTTWFVIEESKKDFCESKNVSYLLRSPNYVISGENRYSTVGNINCYVVRFLYKKTIFDNIKFDKKLIYMEDVAILTQIFLNDNLSVGYIDDCMYNYLIRTSSLSNGKINNMLEKGKSFVSKITEILFGTKFEYLINAEQFLFYYMCATNKARYSTDDNLKLIKEWNSRKNYKSYKKFLTNGSKSKLKAFLIHYKMDWIFKLVVKLKNKT